MSRRRSDEAETVRALPVYCGVRRCSRIGQHFHPQRIHESGVAVALISVTHCPVHIAQDHPSAHALFLHSTALTLESGAASTDRRGYKYEEQMQKIDELKINGRRPVIEDRRLKNKDRRPMREVWVWSTDDSSADISRGPKRRRLRRHLTGPLRRYTLSYSVVIRPLLSDHSTISCLLSTLPSGDIPRLPSSRLCLGSAESTCGEESRGRSPVLLYGASLELSISQSSEPR